MTTVYKLTDRDGYTRRGHHNECLWGVGVSHEAKGSGGLCTDGVIHAYTNPIIAAVCNQEHANISNPRIFVGQMEVTHTDSWKKVGGKALRLTEEIEMPSVRQITIFSILCARRAFEIIDASPDSFFRQKSDRAIAAASRRKEWEDWADKYTKGDAEALTDAASDAAYVAACAARAAAYAASDAARAASDAAYAAAYAASRAAAYAAYAASDAAYAAYAAYAARAAAYAAGTIDFAAIAAEALRYK